MKTPEQIAKMMENISSCYYCPFNKFGSCKPIQGIDGIDECKQVWMKWIYEEIEVNR